MLPPPSYLNLLRVIQIFLGCSAHLPVIQLGTMVDIFAFFLKKILNCFFLQITLCAFLPLKQKSPKISSQNDSGKGYSFETLIDTKPIVKAYRKSFQKDNDKGSSCEAPIDTKPVVRTCCESSSKVCNLVYHRSQLLIH